MAETMDPVDLDRKRIAAIQEAANDLDVDNPLVDALIVRGIASEQALELLDQFAAGQAVTLADGSTFYPPGG